MRNELAISSQRISVFFILIANMQAKSIWIPISILTESKASPVLALIDLGAQGKFINKNLVKTL
jgi:hypothetical protein